MTRVPKSRVSLQSLNHTRDANNPPGEHTRRVVRNLPGNSPDHSGSSPPSSTSSNILNQPRRKPRSSHHLWEWFSWWPLKQREVLLSTACQSLFCCTVYSGHHGSIGRACFVRYWKEKYLCQFFLHTVNRMSPYLSALKFPVCHTLFKTLLLAAD